MYFHFFQQKLTKVTQLGHDAHHCFLTVNKTSTKETKESENMKVCQQYVVDLTSVSILALSFITVASGGAVLMISCKLSPGL